jgi:hypothetical protein
MPITYVDAPKGQTTYGSFLREWRPDSVSQDGQLGSEPVRPVFTMHVPEGANIDAKRKMSRKINDAIVEAYHLPKFMIFMQGRPLDRVALDGGLHSDNKARVGSPERGLSRRRSRAK